MVFICKSNNFKINNLECSNAVCSKWGNNDRPVKMLMLGTGGAGKTTVVRQMKILYDRKFLERERREKAIEVHKTVHECLYEILTYVKIFIETSLGETKKQILDHIDNFLSLGENGPKIFDSVYFDNIQQLWQYNDFKHCIASIKTLQLIEGADYFLERLNIILHENYIPTEEDILQSRSHTNCNQKYEFRIKNPECGKRVQSFWVYDVGGQRSERRKWIQVFSTVDVTIFLVACSEFDQTLKEDKTCNRLKESLKLFADLWTSRFLLQSKFILFLNKQDLLRKKIEHGIDLSRYFPEFCSYSKHHEDAFTQAQTFIKDQFIKITKTPRTQRLMDSKSSTYINFKSRNQECYCHFTIATNTNHTKTIFNQVHTIILNKLMNENTLY